MALAQLVAGEVGGVDLVFEVRAEEIVELGEERIELPLVGVGLFGGVLVEDVGEDGGDVVVGDELLLVDAFHELAAQAVDGLALLVHDVVVLEDVFAGLEVLAFDGLLRGLDALGDHAALDGDAFFHAEALEQGGDPLAREDAHEVVFEGEEEAGGAGVALASGAATELVVDAAGLVALGAEDVEAAGGDDCVVLLAGLPLRGRRWRCPRLPAWSRTPGRRSRSGPCRDRRRERWRLRRRRRRGPDCLRTRSWRAMNSAVAAEQDVGTAAGHVGGDGDHAEASGLGDDLGFLLVELGVEDDVADALALEDVAEEFGLFDAGGADQDGLLFLVELGDLVGDGEVFFLRGAVDDVGVFDALHDAVGRGDDDVELVDLSELGGFGLGGAGHAGELLVHAEVVLEGDGGERLVFLADVDAFLGFDGLVQSVGPAAAGHEAAGELVDDDDFALFDDVLDVALVEGVGFDGDFDVVLEVPVFGVGDVADAEELLDLLPALVGDGDGAGLLVDDVVAGVGLGVEGLDEFAVLRAMGMMTLTRAYLSVVWSVGPQMMSGVRASSMRMESTSSTMQ